MKPIAKRKWEDLENAIVEFYQAREDAEKRKQITLRTFYPEWFDYKWQDTNNSSYMHKIASDWKRFYEDDPIVDRPIVELTTLELKTWARNKIISCKLSKKIYYNMAVIIRQSLDYLVELGELPSNPYANFKIKASLFTPVAEKEPEYEVFSETEEQQIKEYALQDFERNTAYNGSCGGVKLFFGTSCGRACGFEVEGFKRSVSAYQTYGTKAV